MENGGNIAPDYRLLFKEWGIIGIPLKQGLLYLLGTVSTGKA